jgi:DNA polymerase-1
MKVILDAEFSGFELGSHCWCIVAQDIETGSVYIFEHPELNPKEFLDFSQQVELYIGHNIIQFDWPRLCAIFPSLKSVPVDRICDTLVVSHTVNFSIQGGHSLEAWAERLSTKTGLREKSFSQKTKNNFYKRTKPWYNTFIRVAEEITNNIYNNRYINNYIYKSINNNHIYIYYNISPTEISEAIRTGQKIQISDFTKYTRDLLYRCVSDCDINLRLYNHLLQYINHPAFVSALATEHQSQWYCLELSENGFAIDYPAVSRLYGDVSERLTEIDQQLQEAFPPKRIQTGTIIARETQHGSIHSVDYRRLLRLGVAPADIIAGHEYPVFTEEVFSAASHKQIVDRLWDAGWCPTDRTKGHRDFVDGLPKARKGAKGPELSVEQSERLDYFKRYGWTTTEENLATLPATAPAGAQRLIERLLLANRRATLEQYLELAKREPDGTYRIHGKFNHIGAWTQRKSHANPNMANVPKVVETDGPAKPLEVLSNNINRQMRSVWIASPGNVLVGVDADGIQMRIFAHYVNDQKLTDALINGSKKNATDIHSVHQRALGPACRSRDAAKRFIYAWLLGAGIAKVAEILECSFEEAKIAVESFIAYYPGLRELKRSTIPADAARGYFVGLDGRFVRCDNAHLMLAGYLQNGESVIMKLACQYWHSRLILEKVPFRFVNDVHDEWQTECPESVSEYIQAVQIESFPIIGDRLKMNCPLAGSGSIGHNWMETH